jgi:hypothetical protein
MLQGLASVMLVLSLVIYLVFLAPSLDFSISLIIMIVGLVCGILGVWIGKMVVIPRLENWTLNVILLSLGVILFLAGAIGVGSKVDTGHEIAVSDLIMVLLFGFFTLAFIELTHAGWRFKEIDDYARTHELRGFNLSAVVNNYFMWFGILMGIIITLSFLILVTHYGLLLAISATNDVFGASIELNSIYVFAIAVAVWFIPMGIFAAIIFGEGSLISSTKTILIKSEKVPGEEMVGLQAIEKTEDMRR